MENSEESLQVESIAEAVLESESGGEIENEEEIESDAEQQLLPEVQVPLSAQIGALLFVAPKPLTTSSLAESCKSTEDEVELAINELQSSIQQDVLGFSLCEVGGAWQLRTSPKCARVIHSLIPPKAKRLSKAAAETLAIVAYKQPVQKAEIESIRGVDALPTIRTLLDAKLIRIVGHSPAPGQPALYGTTHTFLEKFGLSDLSNLPSIRELVEISNEPGESVAIETIEHESDESAPISETPQGVENLVIN